MKTFVIGDIHAQYDALLRVLDIVRFSDSDRLIILGDTIDRGPDSRAVVEWLKKRRQVATQDIYLLGNHEDMFLKLSQGKIQYWNAWLDDGDGRLFLKSYGIDPDRIQKRGMHYFYITEGAGRPLPLGSPEETMRFFMENFGDVIALFRDFKVSWKDGDYFFCHAGIEAYKKISEQTEESLIWGDDRFLYDDYLTDYGIVVVFGHYHLQKPMIGFKKICCALAGRVGVLDMKELSINDSEGNNWYVDPDKLLGGFLKDYMPMPKFDLKLKEPGR